MLGVLVLLVIEVVSVILNRLLQPAAPKPPPFQIPECKVGIAIPVFYGTVQIAPNTVWFGNVFKKQDGNYYAYFADMVNVIGWGLVNEVIDIIFAGKSARNNDVLAGGDPVLSGSVRGPNFLSVSDVVNVYRSGNSTPEVVTVQTVSVDGLVLRLSGLKAAQNTTAILDVTTGITVPISDPKAYAYVNGTITFNDETRVISAIRGPVGFDQYVVVLNAPFGLLGTFFPQGNTHDLTLPGPTTIIVRGDQNTNGNPSFAMFGGEKQGGGPQGVLNFYWGWDGQPVDAGIQGNWGISNTSAYPRLCYATFGSITVDIGQIDPIFTGITLDSGSFQWTWNNPTPPPVQFVLRRTAWVEGATSPLGSVPETIVFSTSPGVGPVVSGNMTLGNDANPAEIIYDLMTDVVYGLGLSPSLIDIPSFSAAATALRTEVISATHTGFGLSLIVADTKEAVSAIGDILNHVDAIVAADPESGQLQMRLIRADYTFGDCLVVNETNASDLQFSRGTWRETVNEVVITYRQFMNDSTIRGLVDSSVTAQDLANRYATGGVRSQTTQMSYVTHPDIAALIAQRQLRKVAFPLAKLQFKMSRIGHHLRPGDVINFSWTPLGISNMAVRVLDVNYGTLQDGTMAITGTEDIFNVTSASYTSPPPSGWVPPNPTALSGYGFGYGFTYGEGS